MNKALNLPSWSSSASERRDGAWDECSCFVTYHFNIFIGRARFPNCVLQHLARQVVMKGVTINIHKRPNDSCGPVLRAVLLGPPRSPPIIRGNTAWNTAQSDMSRGGSGTRSISVANTNSPPMWTTFFARLQKKSR